MMRVLARILILYWFLFSRICVQEQMLARTKRLVMAVTFKLHLTAQTQKIHRMKNYPIPGLLLMDMMLIFGFRSG